MVEINIIETCINVNVGNIITDSILVESSLRQRGDAMLLILFNAESNKRDKYYITKMSWSLEIVYEIAGLFRWFDDHERITAALKVGLHTKWNTWS